MMYLKRWCIDTLYKNGGKMTDSGVKNGLEFIRVGGRFEVFKDFGNKEVNLRIVWLPYFNAVQICAIYYTKSDGKMGLRAGKYKLDGSALDDKKTEIGKKWLPYIKEATELFKEIML